MGDVTRFLDKIKGNAMRDDCRALANLMEDVTGEKPVLWGSMIGFGSYHYRYASGREGDSFKVGFAPRGGVIAIYLMSGLVGYDDLLDDLGPHKATKSKVEVKHLDDVNQDVLAKLLQRSVHHLDQVEAELGGVPRMAEMPPYRPRP